MSDKKSNKIFSIFKFLNNDNIRIFLLVLIILFTILLGFYPGIVSYDGNNQWQQVQSGIITNAHPFFSTFFMLLLSKLWNRVTIIIIYQILLFSFAWSYLCSTIKIDTKKKKVVMYIYTIMVILFPLTSLFQITLWKDIIYTSYLFICAIMLYDWSNNNYEFSSFKYSLFGILLAMVFNYRHNGIIVVILMLFIFYIFCIKKYRSKIITKSNFKKCFCVLISFIIMILIISIPKKIILNESEKKLRKDSSYSESYSTIDGYMLWMMGAHIKENNIKNTKDKILLNKIIPIKEWKRVYNPYLINETHLTPKLNKKYLIKNSKKFETIFIKYSKKYPLTIFNHYLKADALLFNPLSSMYAYVYTYCFPEMGYLPEYTIFRPKLAFVKSFYIRFSDFTLKKPFIIFYQPAIILYVSLVLSLILSKKVYGKKIWLFLLPMILNTISLTPINLAQDLRYVYINYLTFYGLGLMFFVDCKKVFSKNNELKKANKKIKFKEIS